MIKEWTDFPWMITLRKQQSRHPISLAIYGMLFWIIFRDHLARAQWLTTGDLIRTVSVGSLPPPLPPFTSTHLSSITDWAHGVHSSTSSRFSEVAASYVLILFTWESTQYPIAYPVWWVMFLRAHFYQHLSSLHPFTYRHPCVVMWSARTFSFEFCIYSLLFFLFLYLALWTGDQSQYITCAPRGKRNRCNRKKMLWTRKDMPVHCMCLERC